jgi:hypothetical protein
MRCIDPGDGRRLRGLALLVALATFATGCGGPATDAPDETADRPDDLEEVATAEEEVPTVVRSRAEEILGELGPHVACNAWYWDQEDDVWECTLAGLSRPAELDLEPDGGFSEMEFVMGLGRIELAAPYLDDMIEETCGQPDGVVIEVSIRRESDVNAEPDFDALWGTDGVFLEVQCPDGTDFEVDGYGSLVLNPNDDIDP